MTCDVLVVGAGNAALCAAISAREHGADVLVLERAPIEERGGNSRFTAGGMRFAYGGMDDLEKVVTDLSASLALRRPFAAASSKLPRDPACAHP